MKRLRVTHSTGYRYGAEVSASYNEARMLPVSGARQLVLHASLDVRPVSSHHQYTDYWGTRVLAFDVLNPHRELTLTATSLVEVLEPQHASQPLGWEELAETVSHSGECVQQLRQTPLTEPPASLVALAAELGGGPEGDPRGDDPCTTAHAIAAGVGAAMSYESGVTGVRTTAAEAWESRSGVCQDIAHVAVGALRCAGIPARYVSGYLHPKADAVVGGDGRRGVARLGGMVLRRLARLRPDERHRDRRPPCAGRPRPRLHRCRPVARRVLGIVGLRAVRVGVDHARRVRSSPTRVILGV